ncbi:PAS domain-containing sensor histidine kinase [Roseomonas sp. 18066]|uniref:hybrid sensor histidine kinase/response regulator n=1 Tax=Roseomonas sp. 18066 TaxID=2681412 RepID=UPI001F490F1D|nr:PAS domain-containing sensor histidine kinase [Roseomonas sp. 18066]
MTSPAAGPVPSPPAGMAAPFPASGGAVAARIRDFPWDSTPLGPITGWPVALRLAVDTAMASHFPKCLFWGPALISIYNDAYLPMLGEKPEALGKPMREVWPEVWHQIGPIADRALAGASTFIEDFALQIERHGYLEEAFFTFCYSPIRDEAGRVAGMIDTVIESTGKVLAERALRQERARLAEMNAALELRVAERTADRNRLWQLTTDLMLVARFDRRIAAANPAWTAVLGWREAELIGRDLSSLVLADDRAALDEAMRRMAEGQASCRFDTRLQHRDGGHRWIAWNAVPGEGLVNAGGRDFTAEREQAEALQLAEEQLRQSQKMEAVGQLTGGLAHDFNNMLTGITGSLELLQFRVARGQTDDLGRFIGAAQDAARRAAALTHRLLAFSRRQTLDPKPIDVNRLIAGMAELVERTMGPAIRTEVVAADDLWTVLVDPNQLENALLNLCINARDAMPDGGRLRIETANRRLDAAAARRLELPPGPYLALSVSDSGTGMDPEVARRAFDPFFTTKPLGLGTGLGLSMIYGFARQSGGQAEIRTAPGEGTTLMLYLPRHQGAAEPAGAEPPADLATPLPSRAGTVLVVDDEPTLRMLMRTVLEDLGYTALEAADGAGGLAHLRSEQRIDLLVTDVGLPGGMNGRQMADAGRALRPGLPVLFITGYAESAVIGEGQLEPGMHLLTKPFAMELLAGRIQALLGDGG